MVALHDGLPALFDDDAGQWPQWRTTRVYSVWNVCGVAVPIPLRVLVGLRSLKLVRGAMSP